MVVLTLMLSAELLLLSLLTTKGESPVCQTYRTEEVSQFSKDGDIIFGGIFSFHQHPVSINPDLEEDPGTIQCEG